MTAHVESQKQKVHKEILFRAEFQKPLKIPLRGEAATRRPLRGGVHTDVLDASLPSPPARLLTASDTRVQLYTLSSPLNPKRMTCVPPVPGPGPRYSLYFLVLASGTPLRAVCVRGQPASSRLSLMAHLYRDLSVKSLYQDRKFEGNWKRKIETSTTLYVGNLSFYSTEEQLYEFFGAAGELKRIVMGLDRHTKTPCGFCFVEYHNRSDTEDAVRYLSGCKLDDRIVRADWDGGFAEGRQYGRGRSGGQVREEYRTDFDAQRGGWGIGANDSPAAIPQPRRKSFDNSFNKRGGEGGEGGMPPREREPRREEPASKRTKAEANPRFREDKEDDDEDD